MKGLLKVSFAAMALLVASASVSAYDISVRGTDGQVFNASVDDIDRIDFDVESSPLKFTGESSPEIKVGIEGTDVRITFNASMYWVVSNYDKDAGWLRLSRQFGFAGDSEIVLSIDANPADESRTTTFSVLCGFQEVDFFVSQSSEDDSPYVDIPDEIFRSYVLKNFDTDRDGRLSKEEAALIKEIDCYSSGVKTLMGIRRMSNLERLNCAYNDIEGTLDLSGLSKLTYARVDHNKCAKIDVSGCSSLETLLGNDNYKEVMFSFVYLLEEIDLTGCTSLKTLSLEDNALRSIDLSDCSKLTDLTLTINRLTDIDLSGCTSLVNAHLRKNKFDGKVIDFSACTNLKTAFLSESGIAGVNVKNNSKLVQLELSYNNITELDLSGCPELSKLEAFGNKLKDIDLTVLPKLTSLWLAFNEFETIDVSKNPMLVKLQAGNNHLRGTIDISKNSKLEVVDLPSNQITSISLPDQGAIQSLNVNENNIDKLDVSRLPGLMTLVARNNCLTEVNFANCHKLSIINLDDNQLTSIDFSDCESLEIADINRNKLTELDVRPCVAMTELYVADNKIAGFDPRGLANLRVLELYNNELESVDFTGCVSVDELHIQNNRITYFSPLPLTSLRYIDCRNNLMKSLDFTSNHKLDYAFGTGTPCETVYLSERAPNSRIVFDENCKIYLGKSKDFDDVGGSTWGDGDVDPWK